MRRDAVLLDARLEGDVVAVAVGAEPEAAPAGAGGFHAGRAALLLAVAADVGPRACRRVRRVAALRHVRDVRAGARELAVGLAQPLVRHSNVGDCAAHDRRLGEGGGHELPRERLVGELAAAVVDDGGAREVDRERVGAAERQALDVFVDVAADAGRLVAHGQERVRVPRPVAVQSGAGGPPPADVARGLRQPLLGRAGEHVAAARVRHAGSAAHAVPPRGQQQVAVQDLVRRARQLAGLAVREAAARPRAGPELAASREQVPGHAICVRAAAVVQLRRLLEVRRLRVGAALEGAARRGGEVALLAVRLGPDEAVALVALEAAPAAVLEAQPSAAGAVAPVLRGGEQHRAARRVGVEAHAVEGGVARRPGDVDDARIPPLDHPHGAVRAVQRPQSSGALHIRVYRLHRKLGRARARAAQRALTGQRLYVDEQHREAQRGGDQRAAALHGGRFRPLPSAATSSAACG